MPTRTRWLGLCVGLVVLLTGGGTTPAGATTSESVPSTSGLLSTDSPGGGSVDVLALTGAPLAAGNAGPQLLPPPTDQGVPPAAAAQFAPVDYPLDEFYDDFSGAVEVMETWWATHWSDYFAGAYTSPQFVTGGAYGTGLYDAPAEVVFCGETQLGEGNAYYCPGGHWMAFEIDFLLQARTLGDAFIYMIVAHEWGHSIAGQLPPELSFAAYELQADCLGGAALAGAIRDGLLTWESGDDAEVDNGLVFIAQNAPAWGTEYIDVNGNKRISDHGSPQERRDNFWHGVANGVPSCLPAL
jgi:hypothetical protein